jgi:hypothetical protein
MLPSSELILWTLCRAERRLTCVLRLIPSGSQCSVLYEGLPVAARMLPVGRDVDSWAAQMRSAWESAGWLSVGPSQSSASRSADPKSDEQGACSDYHILHAIHRIVGKRRDEGATDASMPGVSAC